MTITVQEMPKQTNEHTMMTWLIDAGGKHVFHPFWSQWVCWIVTLAGEVNGKPAGKVSPNMTHEIVVAAVSPDHPISANLDPDAGDKIILLQPFDQLVQAEFEHDAAALQRMEEIMHMLREARLSPDSDYRAAWEHLLNGKTFYSQQ